jgi:plastocyanin
VPCEPRPRPLLSRLAFVVATIVALTLVAAACGSDNGNDSGGSSSNSSSSGEITMQDLEFTVTAPVKAGATVTAKNNDSVEHTVTADDGSFNITIEPGKTATFTAPSAAGDYKFHCNIHSNMKATLTVQ